MVQKATSASTTGPRRGRPPTFDHDAVVERAVNAFWVKGFESTTLSDLEEATGVDRSTLYNSFGGKAGLYELATNAYLVAAEESLFAPLHHGEGDGLSDIVDFLARLKIGLTADGVTPGCLIVNDMAAGADPVAAQRYMSLLEDGLRIALRRAASHGVLVGDDIDGRAGVIAAMVLGVNIVSKTAFDQDHLGRLIDGALSEVESWRLSATP